MEYYFSATVHTPLNLITHSKWLGPLPNLKIGAPLPFQVQFTVKLDTKAPLQSSIHAPQVQLNAN